MAAMAVVSTLGGCDKDGALQIHGMTGSISVVWLIRCGCRAVVFLWRSLMTSGGD